MRNLIAAALIAAAMFAGAGQAQATEDLRDPGMDFFALDTSEDFPGGLNVYMYNEYTNDSIILTCQDWTTTGSECNVEDTISHYALLNPRMFPYSV